MSVFDRVFTERAAGNDTLKPERTVGQIHARCRTRIRTRTGGMKLRPDRYCMLFRLGWIASNCDNEFERSALDALPGFRNSGAQMKERCIRA